MRYGAPPADLLFAAAPPGIKFALGENPKQSNWGVRDRRFPQTRMGVEQSIRERFVAARDYRRAWDEHRKRGKAERTPPRRDLQLEALVEILDGRRLVHAHSYRADEILMLLRLADEFGVRLATLQHVLEGYKASHEIARHGAGASSFSDWWAYKHEVIDAIPYNGAIMARHGVVVSFNSDSNELARRLNLEAAKAVRYGGLSEEEALKLVTLNPARQLGVADRVGSLEAGKDADLVVWSGHPLSTYTVCEQTWVDGRKYFDRAADLERRAALAAERDALLAKGEQAGKDKKEAETKDDEKPAAAAPPASAPREVQR
jgi:imidazolonepropionase-like amidohydrolase